MKLPDLLTHIVTTDWLVTGEATVAGKPVSVPGSENFYKMGGIYEMWTDQFPARLQHLMVSDISKDLRVQLGEERGGRGAAQSIIEDVPHA
jgi:malonate decarboxylase gamma subunit